MAIPPSIFGEVPENPTSGKSAILENGGKRRLLCKAFFKQGSVGNHTM